MAVLMESVVLVFHIWKKCSLLNAEIIFNRCPICREKSKKVISHYVFGNFILSPLGVFQRDVLYDYDG